MRYFNIPIFIPELACPFRCVYCNQYNITGKLALPQSQDVIKTIESYLSTIPWQKSFVEVAFFGGSFTGLDMEKQNQYLSLVEPYIASQKVKGIRLSTRPDYISAKILENLKSHGVRSIELGAQSLDDEILELSGRGHLVADVEQAAAAINAMGFELGLQMMTGLPKDTPDKAMETAKKITQLKADTVRIYPTLVIKDTHLARLYKAENHQPQSLEEAVDLCAQLYLFFENRKIKVLRMGLHPSEGFYDKNTMLGGPFHPAFGELVLTKVWEKKITNAVAVKKGKLLVVSVHPSNINAAIGHKALNRKRLEGQFDKVVFQARTEVNPNQLYADYH